MKKRVISMALSLLMLFTAMSAAACGEKTDEDTLALGQEDSNAMTLTIWGVKGEGTTDEAVAAVEAAMSKITQVQFNTAIKLCLYEEDKYLDAITEKMDGIQEKIDAEEAEKEARKQAEREAKKRGETLPETETEVPEETEDTVDETVLDEYGLPTTLYPEVEEDQLDIFLITDYEMLRAMADREVLSALDEQLSGSSKLLKQYIHPTIISAGKVNNKTVAIPNQQLVGEYTYMLINSELLNKYYYDIDNIESLADAYNFILDVKRDEPEYQALVGDTEPININYFSPNNERTLFGNMMGVDKKDGDDFEPRYLFNVTNWMRWIKLHMNIVMNGCIGSETFTPEDKFGVGIMHGTEEDLKAYDAVLKEDLAALPEGTPVPTYYALVLQVPQGTTENVYNGMFAVSTYTKSVPRSMEILTRLNTRSDLRNLFGYGIEGEHYTVGEDGVVEKLNNDYNMKLEYTGNCFMAYVPEGKPADYWDIAKDHNTELALSPYFQFEITEEILEENNLTEMYEYIVEFSDKFYADLEACTSSEQVDQVIDDYWELCEDDETVNLWINQLPIPEEGEKEAPMTMGKYYKEWFAKN